MQRSLQVTFKNMDRSPALDALIQRRVDQLEELYPRLLGCRVIVGVPHRRTGTAKVAIALSVEAEVPGRPPVVGKAEEERHEAKEDQTAALNDAFEAVERQLDKIADVRSHKLAAHEADGESGMVVRLFPEQSYGFIEVGNSTELYFTRNAVVSGFDKLEPGMIVQVTRATDEGPMGPQASSVRLLDRSRTPA